MSHQQTDMKNWTAAILVVAANFIQSVSLGINAVVFPTTLESYGAATWVIGVVLAIEFTSVFLINFGLTRMLKFASSYIWILISALIRFPAIALLAYTTEIPWWLILVFTHGIGNILVGTLLQTWINGIAFRRSRGFAMALFGTSISLGLAAGPVVLAWSSFFDPMVAPAIQQVDVLLHSWFGIVANEAIASDTRHALYLSALISTIAVVPVLFGRFFAPTYSITVEGSVRELIGKAPAIMLAVGLCGVSILGLQSFITLYGMRNGLDLTTASLLLSSFMLGSILLEIPFAWLSDFFDRRYVMMGLVLVSLVATVFLPIAIYHPWQARILLFVWGGVIGGLYSICLAMLSERFTGADLVRANAAFSIMDAAGGMVGILGIGIAMELFDVDGLPYIIMFASLVYMSYAVTRYRVR